MTRQTNTKLFRKYVDEIGARGKAKLAVEAKCGHSTVDQLYRGVYQSRPSERLCECLCEGIQRLLNVSVKMDQLFPLVAAREKAS
jgi:hypothetical protein